MGQKQKTEKKNLDVYSWIKNYVYCLVSFIFILQFIHLSSNSEVQHKVWWPGPSQLLHGPHLHRAGREDGGADQAPVNNSPVTGQAASGKGQLKNITFHVCYVLAFWIIIILLRTKIISLLKLFLSFHLCLLRSSLSSVSEENMKLSLCKLAPNGTHKAPNQYFQIFGLY